MSSCHKKWFNATNLQDVLSYNTPFTMHIPKIAARGGGIPKHDLDNGHHSLISVRDLLICDYLSLNKTCLFNVTLVFPCCNFYRAFSTSLTLVPLTLCVTLKKKVTPFINRFCHKLQTVHSLIPGKKNWLYL